MTTKEKTVILSASNSRDQVSWVRLLQAQKKLNSQMEKKIFYKPQLPSTSSLTHSLKSRTQECSFKEGHKRLSSGINAEYFFFFFFFFFFFCYFFIYQSLIDSPFSNVLPLFWLLSCCKI
eukprot:TRINITY_DN7933_c0_g1_i4.p1 TRINITY_DN7933_c0_g1~~TRINITY_DN7933_c0_g1_i4.p1  ORF type:complete len:131 (+),score=24.60 TRINITY_DN7933_c0_g1_i4:36-395(+)